MESLKNGLFLNTCLISNDNWLIFSINVYKKATVRLPFLLVELNLIEDVDSANTDFFFKTFNEVHDSIFISREDSVEGDFH